MFTKSSFLTIYPTNCSCLLLDYRISLCFCLPFSLLPHCLLHLSMAFSESYDLTLFDTAYESYILNPWSLKRCCSNFNCLILILSDVVVPICSCNADNWNLIYYGIVNRSKEAGLTVVLLFQARKVCLHCESIFELFAFITAPIMHTGRKSLNITFKYIFRSV